MYHLQYRYYKPHCMSREFHANKFMNNYEVSKPKITVFLGEICNNTCEYTYIFYIILVDICIYQLSCWHSVSHCKGKIEMLIDIYLMSHWATSFAAILGIFLLSKAATLIYRMQTLSTKSIVFLSSISLQYLDAKNVHVMCVLSPYRWEVLWHFFTLCGWQKLTDVI